MVIQQRRLIHGALGAVILVLQVTDLIGQHGNERTEFLVFIRRTLSTEEAVANVATGIIEEVERAHVAVVVVVIQQIGQISTTGSFIRAADLGSIIVNVKFTDICRTGHKPVLQFQLTVGFLTVEVIAQNIHIQVVILKGIDRPAHILHRGGNIGHSRLGGSVHLIEQRRIILPDNTEAVAVVLVFIGRIVDQLGAVLNREIDHGDHVLILCQDRQSLAQRFDIGGAHFLVIIEPEILEPNLLGSQAVGTLIKVGGRAGVQQAGDQVHIRLPAAIQQHAQIGGEGLVQAGNLTVSIKGKAAQILMDPDIDAVVAQCLHVVQTALHLTLQVCRRSIYDLILAQSRLLLVIGAVPVIIDAINITILSHQTVILAFVGLSVIGKDEVAVFVYRRAMSIGNGIVTEQFRQNTASGHCHNTAKHSDSQHNADNGKEHSIC